MSDNFASKYLELPPFDYTLYEENCGLEWRNWLRSFEWYLKATHIEDDSEKFVKLLHLAGRKVQELYEALPTPASLSEVACGPLAIGCSPHPTDYGIALCKLNEFFEPKRNATYERHVFRLIKQEKSEQFGIFVMRLRIQSEKCDFGEAAEDNEKDQIIEKCFSAKLRRELLKLGDCKLDNILRSAKVFEAIEEQCKTFDSSVNTNNQLSENVNTIDSKAIFKTNRANDNKIECTRCGYAGHRAFDEKCPARGKLCNKCGGKDHFIRKCRSKKRIHSYNTATTKEPDFKQRMKRESEDRQTKKFEATESETIKLLDSTTKLDEYIFCIGDSKANEISCKIGGVTITVVVDSGSKYNIIDGSNWDFLKSNKVKVSKQRKDADGLEFKAYGGHPLTTIGIFEATVETTSKSCVADFYVVKDYGKALIGYETGIPLLEFLGHKLSASGITPTQSKVEAVQNFRRPSCVAEVRSFLGLVNFVGKFIPNLADLTEPLRVLTKKNATFEWKTEQGIAFESLKRSLTNDLVVGYYDVKNRTQVYADASPIALGAVLIQINEKGPRVITYASKSLSDTEKRYCQTEKEALALVWSVERFNFYLFGRTFELVTDHKALETIFSPTSRPCARIERWVLRLQSYKFKVVYKPGKNNIADPLSRLVVTSKAEPWSDDLDTEEYINYVIANAVPVALKLDEIKEASEKDMTINDVRTGLTGSIWSDRARPFKIFETELCFAGSILLRSNRIVMPESLRYRTIELAHEGHPGITVMKRRLRSKVWWPKIDIEAESFVKKCHGCTMVSAPPPPEPLKRKELPSEPWSHLAIDFMGPLPSSHYLLVVVDYFSRFIEVEIMTKITTLETIKRLRVIFARFGRPNFITADNGTQFISTEFKEYCNENNIQVIHSTPFWPQQNGEVERQNRSILKRLKISQNLHHDWQKELQDYLLMYRSTPHSTTLKSPSELMFGRTIRDKLPQINQPLVYDEELHDRDKTKKDNEKLYADEKRGAKGLVSALRDVSVSIPNAVRRSERAVLKCLYDMEGDSLYSVKWYKGRREFYRYTPKENPAMKTFHIPGIKIDVHYSNESQLTLLNVQLVTSGKYSCEVSADAPSFHTLIAAGELDVVEPPNHNPAISGIRPRYKIGDIVRGNCTSRHSKPAANLTWTINNQEANPSHVRHHRPLRDSRNDMETAISGIHFVVTSQHFLYGKLKVRCTALIHDVYLKSTEKSIEEDRHKYTSNSASGNNVNLVQTLPYDQFALQDGDLIDKKDTYLTNIQGDVSSLNAGGSGSTALISSAPTVTSVVLLLAIVLQLSHFYIHHLCSNGCYSSSNKSFSSRTRWSDRLTQRRTLTKTPGVSLAMLQSSSTTKSLSLPTFSSNPSVSIGQQNPEFKDS